MKMNTPDLAMFIDNFHKAAKICPHWMKILTMKATSSSSSNPKKKKPIYLPYDYKKVQTNKVISYDFTRNNDNLDFVSQTIYNAIASTMAPSFRTELSLFRKEIDGQGPCLLYYVLSCLTERREKVHNETSATMNDLGTFFSDHNYNFPKICSHLYTILATYQEHGGSVHLSYTQIINTLGAVYVSAKKKN